MPGALVTDGQSRAAVAGVRGLGLAGIQTGVLAPGRACAALWSRHCAWRATGPPSSLEPAFVASIGELLEDRGPAVVFPGQEQAVGALARHAHELGAAAILPFPGPGPMLSLSDKSQVAQLSAAAGIPSPTTLASGAAGELAEDPPPTPCVVKAFGLSSALPAARVCDSQAELVALLRGLPPGENVIVQERAAGALIALSVVLDRDRSLAAAFQSRALRLSPSEAGASSLSESVAPDLRLIDRAVTMLRDAGWWGLAHMQFLTTDRGPALIDVNTRFYGSLPLATAAGVNLPAIWHRVAVGGAPQPPPDYRRGVRYRWLEGDMVAALRGEPRRLATRPARGSAGAMWAADDPVPGLLLGLGAVRDYAPAGLRLVKSAVGAGAGLPEVARLRLRGAGRRFC